MDSPKTLLGPAITGEYIPTAYWNGWMNMRRAPPFSFQAVNEMLTDPRVMFGLWLIKGPILSKSRFYIDCDNKEAKDFLIQNLTRFWRNSAVRAMKSIEWGYSCSEALYEIRNGLINFDTLKDLHPLDCRALTREGKLVGATVRNVPTKTGKKKVELSGARSLWTVHSREVHPWYGRSRLFGAYLPWLECWSEGGFRDSRRLFFYKYAYTGAIGYYPNQDFQLPSGQRVSSKDLMREMLEKSRNGATVALPNTRDANGQRAWEIVPATSTPPPASLGEYGKDLKDDIWEGMGIPPEVARAEGTGAYAGRAVPLEAFYAILQEIVNWLITDVNSQIFRVLVDLNFGEDVEYEIVPFGLTLGMGNNKSAEQDQTEKLFDPTQQGGAQLSLEEKVIQYSQSCYPPLNVCVAEPPKGYTPRYPKRLIVPVTIAV